MTALCWAMRLIGIALIAATLAVAGYARFAGQQVAGGIDLPQGKSYLASSGPVAHCTMHNDSSAGKRVEVPVLGARELLDGTRIEAPAGGTRLSCVGGDVSVTSGAVLVYRLAEYDFVPVIAGAVLIVFARFLRPARRRSSQRP